MSSARISSIAIAISVFTIPASADEVNFVKVTDAVFSQIDGLTCDPAPGNVVPTLPRLDGNSPGKFLTIFGMV